MAVGYSNGNIVFYDVDSKKAIHSLESENKCSIFWNLGILSVY
jgi:hypothetical protein